MVKIYTIDEIFIQSNLVIYSQNFKTKFVKNVKFHEISRKFI